MTDPWFYRRDLDASRLRMAAFQVELAAGSGARAAVAADGMVVVFIDEPWWARATLGLWKLVTTKRVIARCVRVVPEINGFCPTVEVRGCRR